MPPADRKASAADLPKKWNPNGEPVLSGNMRTALKMGALDPGENTMRFLRAFPPARSPGGRKS
jgi:hypothetical protein